VIEEFMEKGMARCIAFNHRGTLLVGMVFMCFLNYNFLLCLVLCFSYAHLLDAINTDLEI